MTAFSKSLFWDLDLATFDFEKGRRLVVQRVLTLGTMSDLRALVALYSPSMIRQTVLAISDWEPQIRNFIAVWLDIPKEAFACSTSRLSRRKHWG